MRSRVFACILAVVLSGSVAFSPLQAWAEVRKADVIAGMSVDERGLTVAECPSIDAAHAALISQDGTVYFEREASQASRIASITKVMTAIVAIDNAPEGTFVAVSEAAAQVGESSANLQEGDVLDFESALKALLVPSGNDAAVAIAEAVGAIMIASDPSLGNDPVGAFVHAMNEKAAAIGCTDTLYENPHGLDDGVHDGNLHSTASDQVKVAKCAMEYPLIREIVSGGSTTIPVTRAGGKVDVELQTTDELLEMYKYTIGIKTGVTDSAGPSFMGAASKEGRELYCVVLGSSDELQRFNDAKALFEWAYDHCIVLPLANSSNWTTMRDGGTSKDVPVIGAASHADWIDRTVPCTLANPDASIEVFDFEGNVSQSVTFNELHGTIHVGDKVGTIVFKQHNQVIDEQDLVATETVEGPNIIDGVAIWWQRLFGGLGGSQGVADSEIYNVMPVISNHRTSVE